MKENTNTTILAIETSCDDTGIAIIRAPIKDRGDFNVLSNVVSSQVKLHAKYGGVYPTLAKREHQRNLLPVLIRALKESKLIETRALNALSARPSTHFFSKNECSGSKLKTIKKILEREEFLYEKLTAFLQKYQKPKIDAIAVTVGPGLEPCLWVGVNFAKALSYFWNIPIIPVNHIESHILVNLLNQHPTPNTQHPIKFPAICLIVSGGNTQIFLMTDLEKYKVLGETRDDAAGECFDKTARILGLGYPGGPAIAAEAAKLKAKSYKLKAKLPRPMINSKDYDFSFSGLKTAVLYNFKNQPKKIQKDINYIRAMANDIQQAIIDVLIKKTIKAAKDYNAKTIILGGGVSANDELRKQLKLKIVNCKLKINFLVPPKNLCTDNAVMTAVAGYFQYRNGERENWQDIEVNANLRLE